MVDIKNTHELLDRANLGEGVELSLVIPEYHLQHFLSQVRPSHFILGEGIPYVKALVRTVLVPFSLSLDFSDGSRVEGVKRVEAFGVELDG